MVSEETTNKLKNELVEIVKKPLTDKARINAYNAKYRKWVRIPDLRNEGVNRQFLDNLWAEVTEEFGAEDDAEQKREVERLYNNRIKKFFNYDGSALTLDELSDADFNPGRVTLNKKNLRKDWAEQRALILGWTSELNILPYLAQNVTNNLIEVVDSVDNQLAREIDADELETLELLPQELIKGIRNIRLKENRDKMYDYWERISKLHPKLITAIQELQQAVRDGGESEVADLILQLPNQAVMGGSKPSARGKIADAFEQPKRMEGESEEDFKTRTEMPKRRITPSDAAFLPNYIQEVPAKEVQIFSKGQRFMDWIATIIIGYEIKNKIKGPKLGQKSRDYSDLTGASKRQRTPRMRTSQGSDPDPKRGDWSIHGETVDDKYNPLSSLGPQIVGPRESADMPKPDTINEKIRLPHHVVSEGERKDATSSWEYLDPIFWDSLNDGLDIVIRDFEIDDAKEFVENAITMARNRKMPANEKKLKSKLIRLEKEALKTKGVQDKFHIPLTDWVKDNYKELTGDVDEVNEYTAIFFKKLADIMLLARGQERVQMERNYPLPPKDANTKTPLHSPPADQYSHGKPKPMGLRRTRTQAGRKATKRTDFGSADIQNAIDKVMKLVDAYYFVPILGKSTLFIDQIIPHFSHEMSGDYDFSTLGLLFSNNPAAKQSASIGPNLEANFNYSDLLLISQNLQAEISVENQPDTNAYVEVLEELAQSLKNWSGEERRAAQFASDQLRKYLQGKDEVDALSQYKILGVNANVLFAEWSQGRKENDSIILDIRSWLQGPRFNALVKQREDMGINVTKLTNVAKDILEATSPSKLNNISDIGKSLLLAHDVVRKMQGKEISYGSLSVNSLNDMDYLITKMENKYKVDITTNDVLNIVYSNDSLQSISNNHGLSQDIVYEIKGLCR